MNKQDVVRGAKLEAEKIFMKNNPKGINGNGYFPKINENNFATPYGREATRVEKQVVDTRVKQFKSNSLPKGYKFGR